MTIGFLRTTTAGALLSLVAAGAALADVTAEDVWQNWQDVSAASGQTLDAVSALRSGDTLTVTDMTVVMKTTDSEVTGVLPQVSFRETGDGRVEITMSERYTFRMTMTSALSETSSNSFAIAQNGMLMVASGTPDAVNYDVTADSVSFTAEDFVVDGTPTDMLIDFGISDMIAAYVVRQGEPIETSSEFSAKDMRFSVSGKDDDGSGAIKATGRMSGVAGFSSSVMNGSGSFDMAAMLASGFAADGAFTYNEGSMNMSVVDENGSTTDISTTSQGGRLSFGVDQGSLSYGVVGNGVTLKVQGTAIPFPEVTAAYDEASFDLRMPLAKADTAQDFTFSTRLKGLTVSDFLWNMIDPGTSLPRDPATLIIESNGKLRPLANLMDEKQMGAVMMSGPPVEMHSVDVSKLQLSVAGAELLGDAALTFDNSQPPMPGSFPMPTGKINLSLTGANGLLGKLQALGLVQPDMVMGFGMFSGMMARPGPTPDSLVSVIELQEGGRVLANGTPLPF